MNDEHERFVPEEMANDLIAAEHQARYRLSLPFVRDKSVLDVGCGVGWAARLMFDAGAASVTGVDNAVEAIEAAKVRGTPADFLLGDMLDLPFDDSSFDVVVCFEALEHVHDTDRALDEFVRVVRPGGLLFVSSPNPTVYPSGNPFHLHELTPEELWEGVSARFDHRVMFRQHLLVASTLLPDNAAGEFTNVQPVAVAPILPGHDPYSVAVASSAPLPEIHGVEVVTTSHQLTHLGALSEALTVERTAIHADHERIVAERAGLLEQLSSAQEQLVSADHALHAQAEAIRELEERLRVLRDREVERDRFGAALVRSEQDRARFLSDSLELANVSRELDRTSSALDDALRRINDLKQTVSWRITGPLRSVRRRAKTPW